MIKLSLFSQYLNVSNQTDKNLLEIEQSTF